MARAPAPTAGSPNHLPTTFMLMAQYGGRTFVPIEDVCRDFFSHLTPDGLQRKVGQHEIMLPIVRLDPRSQKSMRGVMLTDLADYLDGCSAAARAEFKR